MLFPADTPRIDPSGDQSRECTNSQGLSSIFAVRVNEPALDILINGGFIGVIGDGGIGVVVGDVFLVIGRVSLSVGVWDIWELGVVVGVGVNCGLFGDKLGVGWIVQAINVSGSRVSFKSVWCIESKALFPIEI
jgi:hypothetical protein